MTSGPPHLTRKSSGLSSSADLKYKDSAAKGTPATSKQPLSSTPAGRSTGSAASSLKSDSCHQPESSTKLPAEGDVANADQVDSKENSRSSSLGEMVKKACFVLESVQIIALYLC